MPRELHVRTHSSRTETWRHIAEIVALSVAAIWGFYVFVYQERIKPAIAPIVIERAMTVEHSALPNGKEFVRVNCTIKNVGLSEVEISAMIVNVYGITFGSKDGKEKSTPIAGLDRINYSLATSEPKLLYSFYDTWHAVGSPKPKNVPLGPGESWTESFAIGVRQGQFDVASLQDEWCVERPGSKVMQLRQQAQADGSLWLDVSNQDPVARPCGYQRNGLYYSL